MRGDRRAVALALTVIAAGALTLRLIGLQYGLPAVYNPDEVAIMARALGFAKGDLNPHNFLYPTFYFYVLFAWVGGYLAFLWLTGAVASVAALQALYFTDPSGIYTAGRLLSALCGTATTVAVFLVGQRLFDRRVGLAAAMLLAVAPLAVRDSHYVKHDVPATLAVLIAYVALTRVWPGRPLGGAAGTRDVLLAAAACGVAFSTHYYCVFLALPLCWAIVERWRAAGRRVVFRHIIAAAGVSAIVFFALSPFLLVEPAVAWRDIVANRRIVVDRAVESGAFGSAVRYLEILWEDSLGPVVIGLAAVGFPAMFVLARGRAILLLAFVLPFLAFIANTAPASRYLNPVLPFLAICAAWALARVAHRWRVPAPAFWLAVGVCATWPLVASVQADLFFRADDTRTLAARFVERNVPAGSTVLIQPYSVPLVPSRAGLIEALELHVGNVTEASIKFQIQLGLDPYPQPNYRLIWLGRGGLDVDKIYVDPSDLTGREGLAPLQNLGVTYVILKVHDLEPDLEGFRGQLRRGGALIAEFSPFRPQVSEERRMSVVPFLHNSDTPIDSALERPGPPLEIWQIPAK